MGALKQTARELRVLAKQLVGLEPRVRQVVHPPLEYHGTAEGGWKILAGSLNENAVVVDVGIGEDASFSESIIRQYRCEIAALDPTPRAIAYTAELANDHIRPYAVGLGGRAGRSTFFLPTNVAHVSGSLTPELHLGGGRLEVDVVTIADVFAMVGCDHLDLLKLDIEGAEYDVIQSPTFRDRAGSISQLCVEFHHRWMNRGRRATEEAVATLDACGFVCVWSSRSTNEEFTFVRREMLVGRE